MSELILESLDKKRLTVFKKLKFFNKDGILGGGTALSLQIGHRISFDFDIFTNSPPNKNLWRKVKKVFGEKTVKLLEIEDQLNVLTEDGVSVTFFFDDYKNLFDPFEHGVINLINIKDIIANKAFVLGKRPKWRDYVDLYFVISQKILSLKQIIEISERKFGNDFSRRLFLEQLVYWKDVRDYEIEFLKKEINSDKIKNFLDSEAKSFRNSELDI